MRLKLDKKKTTMLALTLILLGVSIAAAYIVWTHVTHITVTEPFEVTTNLPSDAILAPGTYNYTINVKNKATIPYNATLLYNVEAIGCTVNISPPSGTTKTVLAGATVTFDITITLTGEGTATITWKIDRSSA